MKNNYSFTCFFLALLILVIAFPLPGNAQVTSPLPKSKNQDTLTRVKGPGTETFDPTSNRSQSGSAAVNKDEQAPHEEWDEETIQTGDEAGDDGKDGVRFNIEIDEKDLKKGANAILKAVDNNRTDESKKPHKSKKDHVEEDNLAEDETSDADWDEEEISEEGTLFMESTDDTSSNRSNEKLNDRNTENQNPETDAEETDKTNEQQNGKKKDSKGKKEGMSSSNDKKQQMQKRQQQMKKKQQMQKKKRK